MTWTAGAANGGTPVIDYRLSYAPSGSDVFSTLAEGITVTSYSTSVFPAGSEYTFKVESRNAYGYSTSYSNEITILQVQLPDAPISLANNVAITSSSVVGLTWSAGVFDGASPIIDYRVFYDQGTGTWISLKTGITSTSYTVTGLTASQLYVFKVQARNIMGYSEFSSQVSIRAAGIPDQPTAPTTTINGNYVDVAWTAPYDGGSDILSYTIKLKQSDGTTFTAESTDCVGSDPTVMSTTTCSVQISTIRSAPFSIPWGSSVYAKVIATNVVGNSLASLEGNGAIILTYPDPPTTLANNGDITSASVMAMTWSAGAADGGTPVIDYRISYSLAGSDTYQVIATGVISRNYQTASLTQGSLYIFRVESRNAFGYSQSFSNEIQILQAQKPDVPLNLANDATITDATQVGLTWTDGLFNGGSSIIDYRVSYDQGAGQWVTLASGVLVKNFVATSVTANTIYAFKVEARNTIGYSTKSAEFSIRAAAVPDTPAAPTTAINSDQVVISWIAPHHGGSAILSYTITFR